MSAASFKIVANVHSGALLTVAGLGFVAASAEPLLAGLKSPQRLAVPHPAAAEEPARQIAFHSCCSLVNQEHSAIAKA